MRTLLTGILFLYVLLLSSSSEAQSSKISSAEVKKVHDSVLLIDTHNDVTSRTVENYDIGKSKNDGHTNVTSLRQGGVGAVFFAAYVSSSYGRGNRSANRT